jgi:isopenicillin N synthase-like dioxygenase
MAQEGDLLANLAVLNYEKLVKKDPVEASRLLFACANIGFFYLDLSSATAENYRNLVSALNRASQDYFSRPLKEKMKDMNNDWEVFNISG